MKIADGLGSGSFVDVEQPAYTTRRATLDDLPLLQALWEQAGLPWDELEKFLTEFQVVAGPEPGNILGSIGLQVDGQEGLLHSEAIVDGVDADAIRSALWRRLQIVARNLGVARLWTLEDATFWRGRFHEATQDQVRELDAPFRDPDAAWWTFQLRDPDLAESLARERLALLATSQDKEDLQQTIRRARWVAFTVAAVILGVMLSMSIYLLLNLPALRGRF